MNDTVEQQQSTRRISLTKTQRQSIIGAELLSLCQVTTADGSISDEEVASLRAWLNEHGEEDLPAISHLRNVLEAIVADGCITAEERRDLHIALEAILPPDIRSVAKRARRTREEKEKDQLRIQRHLERERQRSELDRNSPIEHLDFMVAGVRYEGRSALVERYARVGQPAYLVRDRGNRYSRNAVEVRTASGHQIGFVPEDDAQDLAPLLDSGHPYIARIKKILTASRYPIPVVVADVYRRDADLPGLVEAEATTPQAKTGSSLSPNVIKGVLILLALAFALYWLT